MGIASCSNKYCAGRNNCNNNYCSGQGCENNGFCGNEKVLDTSKIANQSNWLHIDYTAIVEIG